MSLQRRKYENLTDYLETDQDVIRELQEVIDFLNDLKENGSTHLKFLNSEYDSTLYGLYYNHESDESYEKRCAEHEVWQKKYQEEQVQKDIKLYNELKQKLNL